MNEVWKNIFKEYIKSYEAIQTLERNSIFDEEEKAVHEHNLLFSIIETMKQETEDQFTPKEYLCIPVDEFTDICDSAASFEELKELLFDRQEGKK